jgi:hypothetical protein
MKLGLMFAAATLLMGCDQISLTPGDSITSSELQNFFRKHKVDGYPAVALKKHSIGGEIYLATIHGYPSNLSVCEQMIPPYNKDPMLSAIPGEYSARNSVEMAVCYGHNRLAIAFAGARDLSFKA